MKSESLRNLRTMRHVRTSLENAQRQRLKRVNSLFKTIEDSTGAVPDTRLEQVLAKERSRMVQYEESIMKSRQRLLKAREKLAKIINRNRALTELRQGIQRARWDGRKESKPAPRRTSEKFEEMELRY